jgi:mono/diheme cytochrome c family protein
MCQLSVKISALLMALISPVFLSACDQDNADNSRLHIPGPDFKADTSIGKRLFSTNCIKCHGSGARGTDKGPPLVDKTYRPGHHGDMVFHFAVSKGTK